MINAFYKKLELDYAIADQDQNKMELLCCKWKEMESIIKVVNMILLYVVCDFIN